MRLLSTLFASALACSLFAVPVKKTQMDVFLKDGTRVAVTFWGDEYGCFYMDQAGRMLQPTGENGFFEYTSQTCEELFRKQNQRRVRANRMRSGNRVQTQGKLKVPVILVQFQDKKFQQAAPEMTPAQYYDLYCNGTRDGRRYEGAGSYGAVRDYFAQQSDSTLFWDFEIVGPVTLDHDLAYYGQDMGDKIDVRMKEFYSEAVAKAMPLYASWQDFDNNHDGKIDMAFFIYAGLGQANGGSPETIWPKETHGDMKVGDLTFAVSACCNELRPRKENGHIVGYQPDGIGIMCHELSHALGLPDFYNMKHNSFGMDYWSVMDYGYFAKNGYHPGSYNGYERDFMGWRRLVELKEPQTVRLQSLEKGGVAYKIVNDQNPNEYYVLHNLQKAGWDSALSTLAHGMLVTHVDYDATAWQTNQVNTDIYHQRMTIIPANNKLIGNFNATSAAELLASLAGHPYPGTSANTELTDKSVPAAEVYAGSLMGKSIQQIQEKDGVVTFKFMPRGIVATPDAASFAEKKVPSGYEISWASVPQAEAYALEYTTVDDWDSTHVQTVDSIKGQVCLLQHLQEGTHYKYRLRAMADAYLDSPVSAWKTIDETASGIQDMILEEDTPVTVYKPDGTRVAEMTLRAARQTLPAGLYLMRHHTFVTKLYIR